MAQSSNFRDDVLARADIFKIIDGRVKLAKSGKEFVALCPFHSERSPSFTVTPEKSLWYCHGCHAGGNVIDFVMRFDKLEFPDALKRVASEAGVQEPEAPTPKKRAKGKIVATHDYIDEHGELKYQVCRMEPKDFLQRRPDGNGWIWGLKAGKYQKSKWGADWYPYNPKKDHGTEIREFDECEELPYNLPALLSRPSHTVLIAEGEKDCNNLMERGLLASCNSGGAGKFADPLCQWFTGRNVVILPDNDEPGEKHLALVAGKLSSIANSIRVVRLPGLPPKGDVSDWLAAGGTAEQLRALCKAAPAWEPPADPDHLIPESHDRDPDAPPPWSVDESTDERHASAPFRALGFDDGHYYFLPHRTQQVTPIGAGSITSSAQLLGLAPLEWWEHAAGTKSGVSWATAANLCIRWCEQVGTFDPGAVRGRGAWFDAGRPVLHLGNRLLVDRKPTALHAIDSRFIYQRAPGLESGDLAEPLPASESRRLADIVQAMNWTRDIDRIQFAGAIALGPVCGALAWRPHIWITSQRGAGKSWMLDNIVSPVLGSSALVVQGNSTEAGIRQQLRQDARPILFDEAEGENIQGRMRMQHILELARQASSDGIAQIAKGTANGRALTYRVRSMFILASINVGLSQAADRSRFTVLNLGRPREGKRGREQFDRLADMVNNTLTEDWCARLRARMYSLIPVIRSNAATFAKAAAETIGNQRAGDQVGALLAGSYALHSDDKISLEDARLHIGAFDWSEQQDDKTESDEAALMAEILHAQIRIESHTGLKMRSVAELVLFLRGENDNELRTDDARNALIRHGLKVDSDRLIVSASHPEIKKMLERSPWAGGHARILARIEGAQEVAAVRFAGVVQRAVSLQIDQILGKTLQK